MEGHILVSRMSSNPLKAGEFGIVCIRRSQMFLVYAHMGELDKTIENFEKFLELAPQAPEAETVRKLIE